jgi:hypothetical protein
MGGGVCASTSGCSKQTCRHIKHGSAMQLGFQQRKADHHSSAADSQPMLKQQQCACMGSAPVTHIDADAPPLLFLVPATSCTALVVRHTAQARWAHRRCCCCCWTPFLVLPWLQGLPGETTEARPPDRRLGGIYHGSQGWQDALTAGFRDLQDACRTEPQG